MLQQDNRILNSQQLSQWIDYETRKYGRGGGLRYFFPISENDVLRKHIRLLRITEYHVNSQHKIRSVIYRTLLYRMQNKYSLHIPVNTCGRGLKIMHVGPVLINGRATVGEDCSIHINTSIVAGGPEDDVPTIGNKVCIGVGAVIIGGVRISDNSTIGANAVVTKSIEEPNCTIAGIPATILHRK